MPDLRYGAGTAHRHRARRRESRAAGHDSPLLGRCGADHSSSGDCHGRHASRHAGATRIFWRLAVVDRVAAGQPGCALGWVAILPAGLGLDGKSFHQYVHADRDGHRRGVSVQPGGDAGARDYFLRHFASMQGTPPVYFEAAAAIVTLVLLRAGSRTPRSQPHRSGHSCAARLEPEDRPHSARCQRRRHSPGSGESRRSPAGPPRRENPGGRGGARRQQLGG